MQYADFAALAAAVAARASVLEAQLAYWREQLAGAPPVLELPPDRPRPAVQSFRGAAGAVAARRRAAPRLCSARPARRGRRLFMTLLPAFEALLAPLHAGRTDIVVGRRSPAAAGRDRGADRLLRQHAGAARRPGAASRAFARAAGAGAGGGLAAYAHQDLPFEKLVEELQPERDLGHTPLFQVVFVLQNTPRQALELPGLTLAPDRCRERDGQVRPDAWPCETPAGARRLAGVRHRPVRRRHGPRACSGTSRLLLAGIAAATRSERLSELPAADAGGAAAARLRMGDAAAELPRSSASTSGSSARRRARRSAVAVVCEGETPDLRRARPAGPTGWPATCAARACGPSALVALLLERSLEHGGGILACSRPAAPTCRSIPPIRRSGWPSCWRTRGRARCC